MKTVKSIAFSILSFCNPMPIEIQLNENNFALRLKINEKEKKDLSCVEIIEGEKECCHVYIYDRKEKHHYYLTLRFYDENGQKMLSGGLYPSHHIGGCSIKPVAL